ncbi:hypothetical protein PsYK624_034080 [Phanerochaete sordida]|uniref:Uncharacterized protein n=1 Tax=Phanerochaete sordida TaxID=48140 RepID=A0A9P3L9N5_9APHY|nr:hypothetical protein PsYK624_034080 [Phanerochaete sordida]
MARNGIEPVAVRDIADAPPITATSDTPEASGPDPPLELLPWVPISCRGVESVIGRSVLERGYVALMQNLPYVLQDMPGARDVIQKGADGEPMWTGLPVARLRLRSVRAGVVHDTVAVYVAGWEDLVDHIVAMEILVKKEGG